MMRRFPRHGLTRQRFTPQEIKELLISWIFLSIIFSIPSGTGAFPIILFTLGLAFIGHELAHTFVAQNYGFLAQYRMDMNNLLFALFLALITKFGGFPIIFAAPGAVVIYPFNRAGRPATPEQAGRISFAGALTNLTFAALFALLKLSSTGLLGQIASVGLWVNGFLALFNLIPIGILDGKKVFAWSRKIWLFGVILAIIALTL